jgi:hypothetical protein
MSDPYADTFEEIYGETEQEKIARRPRGMLDEPDWENTSRYTDYGAEEPIDWSAALANIRGQPRRELKLIPFEAIRFNPAVPYVVEGIIPRNGLVTIWGPPKCGKSFMTFDLAMHVALGWPYRKSKVEQGTVVYVAAEGGIGFANRVEAWRLRHLAAAGTSASASVAFMITNKMKAELRERGFSDQDIRELTPQQAQEILSPLSASAEDRYDGPVPFYLLPTPMDLIAEQSALITAIQEQAGENAPTLVVIDALNRTLVGSENKPEDMAKYIRAADVVRVVFGCAVIIIHHCGVDGSRPRGHTSLAGADDAQIAVSLDGSGLIKVEVEHLKDGVAAKPFACRLETVEVGTSEDGSAAVSCVVVPAELTAASATGRGSKVNANQQRFLDILADAILDAPDQQKTTYNIPGGRTAISREWLKECLVTKGWLDVADADNTRRALVSKMINALAGKRLIGASKLFVWDAR